MNSKHINGTISELLALQYFVNKGYIVSKPIDNFNEYDLIIDNNGKLNRVQVKTVYYDNNKKRYLSSCVTSHIHGNYRRTNKKYTLNSFDLYAFVCRPFNCIYIIPIDLLEGRRSITFYPDNPLAIEKSRYDNFENFKDVLI